MTHYWPSLLGGMLLGLSAALLLLVNGRIAGISGIVGRLIGGHRVTANAAFVLGLVAGPLLYGAVYSRMPAITVSSPWYLIVFSGLMVGAGTRMGSGCTSGHGILGLARLSRRSLAATATFLLMGIATATIMERMI
ncbi:MAG: YeeE/YedE family protein [Rhizobium sp.]|nr:MAG: YeeE/YedE family protein [Rhizobium sp.]